MWTEVKFFFFLEVFSSALKILREVSEKLLQKEGKTTGHGFAAGFLTRTELIEWDSVLITGDLTHGINLMLEGLRLYDKCLYD